MRFGKINYLYSKLKQMNLHLEFNLTFANAFYFVIPFFIIRYLLPQHIKKSSLANLDFFPDTIGVEKIALTAYFILHPILFIYPVFLTIKTDYKTLLAGLFLYILGIILYSLAIFVFVSKDKLITKGVYKFSRNPQYLAFILFYSSIGIITQCFWYLIIVFLFFIALHFIIRSEEHWCSQEFGNKYLNYTKNTSRYLGFK